MDLLLNEFEGHFIDYISTGMVSIKIPNLVMQYGTKFHAPSLPSSAHKLTHDTETISLACRITMMNLREEIKKLWKM